MESIMEHITQQLLRANDRALSRARVIAVLPEAVVVTMPDRESQACDVLETAANGTLVEGDTVLVWLPSNPEERCVVLGRVTPALRAADSKTDDVVIEASKSLTLRCGSGSITIREDGKVLMKGKDLVSHATRLNRVKGGAVQIN